MHVTCLLKTLAILGSLVTNSCLTLVTPWTVVRQDPLSIGFPRQSYWSGCHFLLQGIFLTQGSNLVLLHCRQSLPTESSGRPISQSQRNEHNKTKTDTFATIQWHQLSSPKWLLLFSSVQSLSRVQLSVTPWIAACQPSLSITTSRSSPKLMSIKLVMPSNHLILWHPLLFLPPIPPSIRVFSNESTLCIRWPKYWSFSFSISPSKEYPGLISFQMDWLDLLSKGLSRVFSNTTVQKHQFFSAQLSSLSNFHIHTWPLEKP